jgi:hypothetical protein
MQGKLNNQFQNIRKSYTNTSPPKEVYTEKLTRNEEGI